MEIYDPCVFNNIVKIFLWDLQESFVMGDVLRYIWLRYVS